MADFLLVQLVHGQRRILAAQRHIQRDGLRYVVLARRVHADIGGHRIVVVHAVRLRDRRAGFFPVERRINRFPLDCAAESADGGEHDGQRRHQADNPFLFFHNAILSERAGENARPGSFWFDRNTHLY